MPEPLKIALGFQGTDPTDAVELARRAETAGVARMLVSQNPSGPDAFTLAAHILGRTGTIAVGPGLVSALDRPPLVLARQAITCSAIAPGRTFIGLGRSSRSYVEGQLGLPYDHPTERLEETLRVLGPMMAGAEIKFEGRLLPPCTGTASAADQPAIPIFLGASGPRTLDLAGRLAQGALLNGGATSGYVSWATAILARATAAAGRDPTSFEVSCWCLAAVNRGGSWHPPLAAVRRQLAEIILEPDAGHALLAHSGLDETVLQRLQTVRALGTAALEEALRDMDLLAQMTVLGDPDQCRSRLNEIRARGVVWVVLQPAALAAMLDI